MLIGKHAPDFTAKAAVGEGVVDDFTLSQFKGKYVVFFFYPLDFTYVCPTELHAFQERLADFQKKGAVVIACSIDSWFSHLAWLNTPKEKGGICGVSYPLVSDLQKTIAHSYGVLNEEVGIAYRGLFLIDREGVVRCQMINDLSLGRSVDEVLRLLDALICFETQGEVCPANWKAGERTMKPSSEGLASHFQD